MGVVVDRESRKAHPLHMLSLVLACSRRAERTIFRTKEERAEQNRRAQQVYRRKREEEKGQLNAKVSALETRLDDVILVSTIHSLPLRVYPDLITNPLRQTKGSRSNSPPSALRSAPSRSPAVPRSSRGTARW